MSLLYDVPTLLVIIGMVGGIVASFFRDKLFRQKEQSDDKEELLKIINNNKEQTQTIIKELEIRINNIVAANNVKVDLFWRIVEERVPRLLMTAKGGRGR